MNSIVVIADDLTGAADCAAPSVAHGFNANVLLYSDKDAQFAQRWPDDGILSVDANTRCLAPAEAAEITSHLVHLCDSHYANRDEYLLFKKIDSTLRGNIAAELAALLRARRAIDRRDKKLSILMTPAVPSQGRTVVGGRLFVHGTPLEQTNIWNAEPCAPQSNISKLLGEAGLSCRLVDTAIVRAGLSDVRQAISNATQEADVIVCDAETDEDLCAIAAASLGVHELAAWAGSAGLAAQLFATTRPSSKPAPPSVSFVAGPTLFVVGTGASVSRQQLLLLEAIPGITTIRITPDELLGSQITSARLLTSIKSGRDILLVLDPDQQWEQSDRGSYSRGFSNLILPCAEFLGGLVATGGETARAVLDVFGLRRLRLLGEVEPGLPFSVAEDWTRALPVVTKAGAFGATEALVHCHHFLKELKRGPGASVQRIT